MTTEEARSGRPIRRRSGEIRLGRTVPWRTFNNSVLERNDLGVHAKMVYVVLSSHATANDQRCFPSYATVAREASVARRTAIRAVAELVATRLLVKTSRYRADSRSPTSNLYVLFPADAPFDPEEERIAENGRVVPLGQEGDSASEAQVAPGDSQSPGWGPGASFLVTDRQLAGAPEAPGPRNVGERIRRSVRAPEPDGADLTRPRNETRERRHDDDLEEPVRRVVEKYRLVAGEGIPRAQARQLIGRYGTDYVLEKMRLLAWQDRRRGFTSGPLAYLLAALAGNWPPPTPGTEDARESMDVASRSQARDQRERLETRGEKLLDALPEAERIRIEAEVSEGLARGPLAGPIPPFVLRTELLRRVAEDVRLTEGDHKERAERNESG
jgi:hypothetical protein